MTTTRDLPDNAPVRMKDVAARAGVSLQTVSRVLNSSGPFTAETAARVREAVLELGYRPNLSARSLASKQSRTVGVVVLGEARHGLASSLLAVEQAARGIGLLTVSAHVAPHDAGGMRDAVDRILGSSARGIVVMGPAYDGLIQMAEQWGSVPTVVLTTMTSQHPQIATVAIDQDRAMHQVVDHLVEVGCRRVAHISGDRRWSDARLRADAFAERARHRGLDASILPGESWDAATGAEIAAELPLADLPDAIVASNDSVALGVMSALSARGVRIPQDVKVVGFDDLPESAYFRPSLTTVRQDFRVLGTTAIAELDDVMNGAAGGNVRLPAPLIVRTSTRGDDA